jgi:hypothetical protein
MGAQSSIATETMVARTRNRHPDRTQGAHKKFPAQQPQIIAWKMMMEQKKTAFLRPSPMTPSSVR